MGLGILLKDDYRMQGDWGSNPVSFASVSNTPIATIPAPIVDPCHGRHCQDEYVVFLILYFLIFPYWPLTIAMTVGNHMDGYFVTSRGTSGTMDFSTGRVKESSVSSTQLHAACLVQNR